MRRGDTLPSMSTPGSSDRGVLRTVVADDTPRSLEEVCLYLASLEGIEIVARVRNGADAVAAVAGEAPDLVVLDYNMPAQDGIEATRRIKALAEPPRVILLTLQDEPEVRWCAREAGVDGFCAKTEMDPELNRLIAGLFPGFSPG
jgi:two-component system, NarL family, response regulator EvgA